MNGKVKEYDANGNTIFKGEYQNGRRLNGKVRENYSNGPRCKHLYTVFEGEYLNGELNGKSKEYFYEYFEMNLLFEGTYLNGLMDGKGKQYDHEENKLYEVEYLNGHIWNGILKRYNCNSEHCKLIFEGEYLNGLKNGKVKEYDYNDNLLFEGEYLNGVQWNGKGKTFDDSGKLIFEGEFFNGRRLIGKEYIYDENGNLLLNIQYTSKNEN